MYLSAYARLWDKAQWPGGKYREVNGAYGDIRLWTWYFYLFLWSHTHKNPLQAAHCTFHCTSLVKHINKSCGKRKLAIVHPVMFYFGSRGLLRRMINALTEHLAKLFCRVNDAYLAVSHDRPLHSISIWLLNKRCSWTTGDPLCTYPHDNISL